MKSVQKKLKTKRETELFDSFNPKRICSLHVLLAMFVFSHGHESSKFIFFASVLMHNSTDNVIKQLVHAFSCALSSYRALGKFGEHSRS